MTFVYFGSYFKYQPLVTLYTVVYTYTVYLNLHDESTDLYSPETPEPSAKPMSFLRHSIRYFLSLFVWLEE